MNGSVVFTVLNAKYVHASPAPWCLAAGVKAYAPELFHRVSILEATINQELTHILERIVNASPSVVTFSCYLWNIQLTLDLCTALKEALPHVVTVLGGPEVSYCAKEVLQNNPQVDYILAGEGEESVPAFLRVLFRQSTSEPLPSQPSLEGLAGLCGRREDGSVYESAPCVLSGAVPSPLSVGYAESVMGRITYFETSRGCPYSCAFCLSGRCGRPRYFALTNVFRDLLLLCNTGTQTIKFVDRTFNANVAHANAILSFILAHYGTDIPSGIRFHFEIAGDILQESTFSLLAQMPVGAVQLEIGMQSFCEETLEAVHRKTNIIRLQENIRRLVAMGNMHIHIDLIAGLPNEGLFAFAESFDKAYALGAQMLQLGFLKLLHGSAMRSEPDTYPCEFDDRAPYEVRSTPWLQPADFALLHHMEDALDRLYNSGRFLLTAAYIQRARQQSAFAFYVELGTAAHEAGIGPRISLDDYTAFLLSYFSSLPGVEEEPLRDCLVRDRLASNKTGRLPPCLYRQDAKLAKASKRLSTHPTTAPKAGVRRGVALLYGAQTVCWVDYIPAEQNLVTGHWELQEIPFVPFLL